MNKKVFCDECKNYITPSSLRAGKNCKDLDRCSILKQSSMMDTPIKRGSVIEYRPACGEKNRNNDCYDYSAKNKFLSKLVRYITNERF